MPWLMCHLFVLQTVHRSAMILQVWQCSWNDPAGNDVGTHTSRPLPRGNVPSHWHCAAVLWHCLQIPAKTFSFLQKTSKTKYDQGGRGWLAFGERNKIPLSFSRARICKFSRQKHRLFTISEHSLKAGSSKDLWKLAKSFLKQADCC